MQGGDFAQKDLAVKVNTEIRNDIVVRSYMTYCGKFREVPFISLIV